MEHESNNGEIRMFNEFFIEQIKSIKLLGDESHNTDQYRKALYMMIIDCIAGIRYPDLAKKNRDKFVKIIRKYGNWTNSELTSTYFLMQALKEQKLTGKLYDKLNSKLESINTDAGNSFACNTVDFKSSDLNELTDNENERKLIKDKKHSFLIYYYRNYLIHEFRSPGYSMESFLDNHPDEAFYHGYINKPNALFLVYPTGLFERLAKAVLDGVVSYLHEEDINPYDQLKDTEVW